jgi:dihydroneopterin aldolase/2-amino-4-hydroxy-6-hydroxymethyldihydropteridine diphosphokinase
MACSPKKPLQHRSTKEGYLGLGSNLGDRHKLLRDAIRALNSNAHIKVVKKSAFHDTAPVGNLDQGRFLNAVIKIETVLEPEVLLETVLEIEKNLGRERREHWGPRTIDIDILAIDDLVYVSPSLSIPHPLMHEREFVLRPLQEIAPDFRHPVFGMTVVDMLSVCTNV